MARPPLIGQTATRSTSFGISYQSGFAPAVATRMKFAQAGTATVLAKLSELLFVQAVRRCIDTLPDNESGWLAALRDRYVGRALSRMHARPAYPWTVDELAGNVGLSRSALAQRFTDLLGQPPMQYLAHWRLRTAAQAADPATIGRRDKVTV